jgi:hypothetical protein
MTHQDEMAELRELSAYGLHLGKHGLILNKGHLHIGVIEDIGDLTVRHISGTRHIGSPTELHGGIGQNPLEAIIREDRDMIARIDPELDQCRRKGMRAVNPCSEIDGVKCPVDTTGREGGALTPPVPRLRKEGGEVRSGNPSGHKVTVTE